MSYPASWSDLSDFLPASARAPRAAGAFSAFNPFNPPRDSHAPGPSQLLEWLRLAARQVFGPELAQRIEPYRACSRCVSSMRWCGEGIPASPWLRDQRERREQLSQLGITPLTPSLLIGVKADPYPPAEEAQRRTRALLERLSRAPREKPENRELPQDGEADLDLTGLEISILTRSPLLLRDLDLLVDLDQRHAVTVGVLIPAADPRMARRVERAAPAKPPASPPSPPSPPSPDVRFDMVRTLAAHGIATEVLCTPVQPGINNSAAVVRDLLDRAHEAGAFDVRPAPRHPSVQPTPAESRQLLALFHRLRLERGFPRLLPGRG